MSRDEFRLGDVVRLKSGGQNMTVIDFDFGGSVTRYIVAFTNECGAFTLTVSGFALIKVAQSAEHIKE